MLNIIFRANFYFAINEKWPFEGRIRQLSINKRSHRWWRCSFIPSAHFMRPPFRSWTISHSCMTPYLIATWPFFRFYHSYLTFRHFCHSCVTFCCFLTKLNGTISFVRHLQSPLKATRDCKPRCASTLLKLSSTHTPMRYRGRVSRHFTANQRTIVDLYFTFFTENVYFL